MFKTSAEKLRARSSKEDFGRVYHLRGRRPQRFMRSCIFLNRELDVILIVHQIFCCRKLSFLRRQPSRARFDAVIAQRRKHLTRQQILMGRYNFNDFDNGSLWDAH